MIFEYLKNITDITRGKTIILLATIYETNRSSPKEVKFNFDFLNYLDQTFYLDAIKHSVDDKNYEDIKRIDLKMKQVLEEEKTFGIMIEKGKISLKNEEHIEETLLLDLKRYMERI